VTTRVRPRSAWPGSAWPRIAWCVLAALGACAAVKLLRLDELSLVLVLLTGLTGLLYLPAELVLVIAVVRRHWAMAVVAAMLTTLHLFWVHAAGVTHDQGPERARGPSLTVVAANLYVENAGAAELGRRLRVSRPDLVVLLEASPTSFPPLVRTGLIDAYEHQVLRVDRSSRGFAVLSRYPLTDVRIHVRNGSWPFLEATVLVGSSRLHLLSVHTISPVSDRRAWREQLAWLADKARTTPGPLLLAGDFNATPFHRSFHRIRNEGRLDDAEAEAGKGWPMTWPATWPRHLPLPTLLQLDHVLVSRDIHVRSARTVDVPGSDHRGVAAAVVLP
jgi:endonuclease/exonuclease/phosphatase (EEP) superfamily protein YafD